MRHGERRTTEKLNGEWCSSQKQWEMVHNINLVGNKFA